jgi:hypothetical protein
VQIGQLRVQYPEKLLIRKAAPFVGYVVRAMLGGQVGDLRRFVIAGVIFP